MSESQIAVLIDYENVGLGSIQGLFDQLSDMGRIIVKRAYADWSSGARQRDQLLELGIEAVHHFHAAKVAKNSSDISLCIDAVDLLYRSPVDTFVIVSADSDFVTLVSKLRSAGKTVIGAGRHDVVSSTLVRACDRYIYLGVEPRTAPADSRTVDALVQRAIYASADDEGKVAGSRLHQTIMRIDPSFDFRSMGFRTFTQFLEGSAVVKVSRVRGSDDISISLKPTGMARLPGIGRVLAGKSRGQQEAAIATPPTVAPALEAPPTPVRAPARPARPTRPAAPAAVRTAPAPTVAPAAVMAAPEPPPLPAAVRTAPAPTARSRRRDGRTGAAAADRAALQHLGGRHTQQVVAAGGQGDGRTQRHKGSRRGCANPGRTQAELVAVQDAAEAVVLQPLPLYQVGTRGQLAAREGARHGGQLRRLGPPDPERQLHPLDLERLRVVAASGRTRRPHRRPASPRGRNRPAGPAPAAPAVRPRPRA